MLDRTGAFLLAMTVVACGDARPGTAVDVFEIASSDNASCDAPFDVKLDQGRRQRIMTTTGNGAGPSFYCPGDGVHSIIRVRNASGRIAYYTDSATFYFVDACAGEPTGMVYVTTGSGETQESIVRVNEFGRTFAGEDLYIVRCQEPNSTHLIELWPSTPE